MTYALIGVRYVSCCSEQPSLIIIYAERRFTPFPSRGADFGPVALCLIDAVANVVDTEGYAIFWRLLAVACTAKIGAIGVGLEERRFRGRVRAERCARTIFIGCAEIGAKMESTPTHTRPDRIAMSSIPPRVFLCAMANAQQFAEFASCGGESDQRFSKSKLLSLCRGLDVLFEL